MKLLSLLSKISIYISSKLAKFNFSQMPVLAVVGSVVVFSCRLNTLPPLQNIPEAHTPIGQAQSKLWLDSSNFSKLGGLAVSVKGSDGNAYTVSIADAQDCKQASSLSRWQVNLNSPFGTHYIYFEFSNDYQNRGVTAEVENRKILMNVSKHFREATFTKLCDAIESRQSQLVLNDNDVEVVLAHWLAMVAPDCEIESGNGSFNCSLGSIEAANAEETLNEIRRTMVRSWSRQPYVLTRRLSVAISLAQAIQASDPDTHLDSLCRVVAHADPIELPLAVANRRWQDSVCYGRNKERTRAANVALQKGLGEIEFLRQLFERTSKLGTLLVRLPQGSVPTKNLWVNLTPQTDVIANLASESQVLGAKMSASIDGDFDSAKACWHPLFGIDHNSMQIGRYLDLTGEAVGISCLEQSTLKGPVAIEPSVYLAESITSETEFVVTNGRSKMLRLPVGSYTYEVRSHSDGFEWEPNADQSYSRGEITWSGKRPNAAIKSW